MKTISIITPIYNESENIIDCCESVKNFFLNKEYDYEHILVDNSSNDDGLSNCNLFLSGIFYVDNEGFFGLSLIIIFLRASDPRLGYLVG